MKGYSTSVMETAEATLRKRKVAKDSWRGDDLSAKEKQGQRSLETTAVSSAQVLTNRSAGGPATFTAEPLVMNSNTQEASDYDCDGDYDKDCPTAKTHTKKTKSSKTKSESPSPTESKMSETDESCAKAVNSESEDSAKQVEQSNQEQAKDAKSYYLCLMLFLLLALYTRLYNIEVPDHVW